MTVSAAPPTEELHDPVPANGRIGWGWWVAGGVVVAAILPLVFLGPGTDLDAGAVLRAGASIVRNGTYVASRPPGAPVHETGVGLLDLVGGTVGANLGSLVAAVGVVVLAVVLLRREGVPRAPLAAAVIVANPWFLLAGVSTVDFLWALAFFLGAAVLLRSGRPIPAGLLAGLAVGSRASTAFLLAALVLAHALDHERSRARRDSLEFAAVAVVAGLLLYLPPFLAADSSLAFAQNDVPVSSFGVQLGRFAVKDFYLFGPLAAIVLLCCIPSVFRALRRFRTDFLVRFTLLGLVASQVLFLRFPWKMGHLLPTLVLIALLLATALRKRPQLLWALVAAQIVYGLVNVVLVQPDRPNAATGGKLTFDPSWGIVVVDTQCRVDDRGAWRSGDLDRIDAVWTCAKPWAAKP